MRAGYVALAALVLVCATVLTGCATQWPFSQPTATPDSRRPDAHQILRPLEIGAANGDLDTLDPAWVLFPSDQRIAELTLPQLVTLDERSQPVDWAAESHEVSADGLT